MKSGASEQDERQWKLRGGVGIESAPTGSIRKTEKSKFFGPQHPENTRIRQIKNL
jgi:hypothetical protein